MDPVAARLVDEAAALLADGDADKAGPMQRYMKSSMPLRGINATPLRRGCAPLFAAHRLRTGTAWREVVLALYEEAAYREERYAVPPRRMTIRARPHACLRGVVGTGSS